MRKFVAGFAAALLLCSLSLNLYLYSAWPVDAAGYSAEQRQAMAALAEEVMK